MNGWEHKDTFNSCTFDLYVLSRYFILSGLQLLINNLSIHPDNKMGCTEMEYRVRQLSILHLVYIVKQWLPCSCSNCRPIWGHIAKECVNKVS